MIVNSKNKRFVHWPAFLLLGLLASLSLVSTVSAGLNTGAGPWQWQTPAVQGNTLNAVSFSDPSTGWAAGTGGTILKTSDGGETWTMQVSGSLANLNAIRFVDGNTGWAVGDDGTLLKTSDGGNVWSGQTLPSSGCGGSCGDTFLQAASFVSVSRGVVVGGGYAFYTSDGGATWNLASGIDSGYNLASVQMISASTVVAVGSQGAIYRSSDGGANWSAATSPSAPTSYDLTSVYFNDANLGFAVGKTSDNKGKLLRTTDGGAHWNENSEPSVVPAPLESIRLAASATPGNSSLVAAGGGGSIYRRDAVDNGSAPLDTLAAELVASAASSGTTNNLLAMSMPGDSTLFVVGDAGVVDKSSNYGAAWSLKAGGSSVSFTGISFASTSSGLVVGDNGVVKATDDGGGNWSAAGTGIPSDADLHGVHYRVAGSAVAVGCQGSDCPTSGSAVAYQYNGSIWTAMSVPPGTVSLNSVHMSGGTTGWAVGSSGSAFKTSDGSNWLTSAVGISASAELNSVDSSDSSNGWAVGQDTVGNQGVIYKYNNSSNSWSSAGTPASPPSFFTSIDMVDAFTGYAVGSGGSIFKTSNGGASWDVLTSGTSKLLAAVSFVDANQGFAVGEDGRVIHTADGGNTWSAEHLGTVISMTSVATVGERLAFVAGGNGAVLKSLRPYYFTWYDNIGASNWVLIANPASATADVWFDLFIGGSERSLPALDGNSPGQIPPGQTIAPSYGGLRGGPVNAASVTSAPAIVSQRILWPVGGNSLEEVLGQDIERLSDHFYWTWYDQQSPGMSDWVLVANPNPFSVYYELKIAGVLKSYGNIVAGQSFAPSFNGVMGGPVELQVWTTNGKTAPAQVMASQRVLSDYGRAFNEVPGTPAAELSDRYLWTWYDQLTPGSTDWVLMANPSASESITVNLSFKNLEGDAVSGVYELGPGEKVTPTFPGKMGGPVEVTAHLQSNPASPRNLIASQRSLWGPSFEEVPGVAASTSGGYSALSDTYYWTWYDQQSAGMTNWVLVANPNAATIDYQVEIGGGGCGGSPPAGTACRSGSLAAGQSATPTFDGYMKGPVRVQAWDASHQNGVPVIASQRVLHNGYFNETLGTDLE